MFTSSKQHQIFKREIERKTMWKKAVQPTRFEPTTSKLQDVCLAREYELNLILKLWRCLPALILGNFSSSKVGQPAPAPKQKTKWDQGLWTRFPWKRMQRKKNSLSINGRKKLRLSQSDSTKDQQKKKFRDLQNSKFKRRSESRIGNCTAQDKIEKNASISSSSSTAMLPIISANKCFINAANFSTINEQSLKLRCRNIATPKVWRRN